ncbi:MAG: sugar phosphate isomerase/epimerase [Kiritimatiellae bacterium]|nr:sugar phosphate isomerase/epimerase [Kiritimatiellia bacterium]
MKFGICEDFTFAEAAASAGFDYLEGCANTLAAMSPEDWAATKKRVADAGIPVEGCCRLLPWEVRVFDPAWTDAWFADYFAKCFDRVAGLGGSFVVFGNGGARRRPPEVPYADACRRFVEVLRLAGDAAAGRGIKIVVEPLNRGETNFGNGLAECAVMVAQAAHPAVQLLADYYHMANVCEPASEIARVGGVAHAHVATKAKRLMPQMGGAEDYIADFLAALRECGTPRLSVESHSQDVAGEGKDAVRFLRGLEEKSL